MSNEDRWTDVRRQMLARLPRALASTVVFFVVFSGIFHVNGHRSWASAAVRALVSEAIFIAAIVVSHGVIVLFAANGASRRRK